MILSLFIFLTLSLTAPQAVAQTYPASEHPVAALEEMRYCGPPARGADGSIKRSATVLTRFKQAHPCPVTGLSSGGCSGWSIDHVIPLACGGCDAVSNLQWLPNAIKSCAASTGLPCKDRWERAIYCEPMQKVTGG